MNGSELEGYFYNPIVAEARTRDIRRVHRSTLLFTNIHMVLSSLCFALELSDFWPCMQPAELWSISLWLMSPHDFFDTLSVMAPFFFATTFPFTTLTIMAWRLPMENWWRLRTVRYVYMYPWKCIIDIVWWTVRTVSVRQLCKVTSGWPVVEGTRLELCGQETHLDIGG